MQINKTDANDAHGIAQLMRTRYFKQVVVKSLNSHRIRTLLGARAQLVSMRTDLKNQVRGVLKTFGFMVSQRAEKGFAAKALGMTKEHPELQAIVTPLMEVLKTIHKQIAVLDSLLDEYVENDKTCTNLMTIPGIGPVTALAFTAAVDNPRRFKKSRSVAAYLGLTSKRYQSGEMDYSTRISKCGDRLVRSYLYEAASALLTRTKRWSSLKSWGLRVAKRAGMKKAIVV